ncbi:TraX family protein [Enterobacter bugandensis]|uniref:TraX family protein n=1 Tax=Enterobacter bugandensis TaxID=881260 RepID=UPI003D25DF01
MLHAFGRMVFPVFKLTRVMNVQCSSERLQVISNRPRSRAVITQPAFVLTFRHHQSWWSLNILFLFDGVTQLLALQNRSV